MSYLYVERYVDSKGLRDDCSSWKKMENRWEKFALLLFFFDYLSVLGNKYPDTN